jgi:hypothetical protein
MELQQFQQANFDKTTYLGFFLNKIYRQVPAWVKTGQ